MDKLKTIKNWLTTPRILQVFLLLTALSTLAFYLTAKSGYLQNERAAVVIGKSTTTGIIAAQTLKVNLSGMHAVAGQQILSQSGGNSWKLAEDYANKRKEVSASLVTASQAITFGAAERVPIERINYVLPVYQTRIDEALKAKERGDHVQAAKLYLQANELVKEHLLTASEQLDEANTTALNGRFSEQLAADRAMDTRLLLSEMLLSLMLIGVQVFITLKFRRFINPYLATATLLVIGFSIHLHSNFQTVNTSLTAAKEEAFDKLHASFRAEAQAYVTRAAIQNRLLGAIARVDVVEDPATALDRLAGMRDGKSLRSFAEGVGGESDSGNSVGYLPRLARREMYEGEREALKESIIGLASFSEAMQRAEGFLKGGQVDSAVQVILGDGGFNQCQAGLTKVKAIERSQFDRYTDQAFGALSRLHLLVPVLSLIVFALVFFGVRVRWSEYNV